MEKILIIDIETTDFLQYGGKIVEVGIVELDLSNGSKKIIFDEVCQEPDMTRISIEKAWIFGNSNLTVDEVLNSKQLQELKPTIQNILNDYKHGATAFNNAFDFGFLEHRGFVFPNKLACPMKLSTNICQIPSHRGFKWPKVEEAHKFFFGDVGYIEAHRGADDAFHEADIVYELYKRGVFTLNNN
ncbi:exonuclease domain-containing protein [Epilithonimonas caeni]|uniref:exonuclease domain-containing protein n=1 Tax=Epilithonimonas caeni TaxID=365343 RepID=UPI0004100946|nr:exonuclease domain-containing protein [Epilithonimonas caeni]